MYYGIVDFVDIIIFIEQYKIFIEHFMYTEHESQKCSSFLFFCNEEHASYHFRMCYKLTRMWLLPHGYN